MIEFDQISIVGFLLPRIKVDSIKDVVNVAVFTFYVKMLMVCMLKLVLMVCMLMLMLMVCMLGMIGCLDLDEFLESFQRGVVISDPKNYVADFCGRF